VSYQTLTTRDFGMLKITLAQRGLVVLLRHLCEAVAVRFLAQKRHGMLAHTLTYTHTHTRTHAHTHTHIHTHIHTHTHTHTHTQTHTYSHTHTHKPLTIRLLAQTWRGIMCECVWTCHAHARKRAHPQMHLHTHTMYMFKHRTHSKNIYIHLYIHIYTCIYTCLCIYMYIYILHRKNPSQLICCTRIHLTVCKALDNVFHHQIPTCALICCTNVIYVVKELHNIQNIFHNTWQILHNIWKNIRHHIRIS